MVYRGQVKGGVIVIEGNPALDEDTLVAIEILGKNEEKSLGQSLMELAGIAEGLPPDFAENHDHYIHGTSKRR